MLNREALIDRISDVLARLESYLKLKSGQNLPDAAVLAEDFCIFLLNLVYGYRLTNLNAEDANFPAVDLIDRDRRVAFQITVNDTTEKIRETHRKAVSHHLAKHVDSLIIFFLVRKAPDEPKPSERFTLCDHPVVTSLDLSSLITRIRSLDVSNIEKIADLLDREMVPGSRVSLPEIPIAGLRTYLEHIVKECDVVWFPGLEAEQTDRLELLKFYADLHTREPRADLDAETGVAAVGEQVPAIEAAGKHERLALLGKPGGGKSTFLRYLAVSIATHWLHPEGSEGKALVEKGWPGPLLGLVPIWIELRQFTDAIAEELRAGRAAPEQDTWIWDQFVARLPQLKHIPEPRPDIANPLLQIADQGRGLFLLDGLDEITEPDQRDFIKEAVRKFALNSFRDEAPGSGGRRNRNRILLTCRERTWHLDWAIDGWDARCVRTIAELTEADREAFLENWFTQWEHIKRGASPSGARAGDEARPSHSAKFPSLAAKLIGELKDPVRNRGGRLEKMVETPLLLSMIAWLRARGGGESQGLPASRAAIYEQIIHALLWELDEHKGLATPNADVRTLAELIKRGQKASRDR